ncbi:bifunctional diguanylate cyclase/phosphodiesterase [Marinimicrobium sp. C2-29]|uniref:bifunctional diguanylate cyclase/phosphodiesterase n=1 Tax=Marinimicrobium sp. C2-29 TaxID=3139825 RepID=UPI0031391590
MPDAEIPADEAQRLATLKALGILDSAPEHRFDRLTRIAAHLLDVPIALISLVDENRQWFKSHFGYEVCETPRTISFCAHALDRRSVLTIPDATLDARFADNPLVTGEPGIRFYMGVPLCGPGGHVLGTLCVIDRKPRHMSQDEVQVLQDLAEVVEDELGRQELRTVSAQLHHSSQRLTSVIQASPLAIITCNMEQRVDVWNPSAERFFGRSADDVVGRALVDISPALSHKLHELSQRVGQGDTVRDERFDITVDDGTNRHLNLSVAPLMSESGAQVGFTAVIADVTERERLLMQTEYEHQLLNAVLSNVDAGVAACDESGRLTVFNRTARDYIGEPVREGAEKWAEVYQVYDATGQRLLSPEELPLYRALNGETVENEEFLVRPEGKPERVLSANGSTYGRSDAQQRGAVVVFHDITARKELERNLKYQATHDLLTGLPNRGALMEILSGAIARAERSGEAVALLFLDLDGFKGVNDTHGHLVGDEVLRLFSRRLKDAVRTSDTVARLSGDEFVIIAEQLKNASADALRIAEKVLNANSTPLPVAGGLMLKTSIGVALHRGHCGAETLLTRADAAMYSAKQQGGSQVFIDALNV